jgi:hypothetical protein
MEEYEILRKEFDLKSNEKINQELSIKSDDENTIEKV